MGLALALGAAQLLRSLRFVRDDKTTSHHEERPSGRDVVISHSRTSAPAVLKAERALLGSRFSTTCLSLKIFLDQ